MHHYCRGLIAVNRYYRLENAVDRKSALGEAIWEFDYTLKNTSPGFSIRPDVYFNRGKALLLQGKPGMAVGDFLQALELSPGMPSASIELARLYKKQGKKDQALDVLKTALAQTPSHKGLRREYLKMGGNLANIPEAAQAAVAPIPEPAETPKSSEPPVATIESGAETGQTSTEPSKAPIMEQKIGNKTNPWCRFCPDEPTETVKPNAN